MKDIARTAPGGNTEQQPREMKEALPALESVLCTEELNHRPSREPDYERENRALVSLAQALADSPRTILQTLTDTILEALQADSAGISLVTENGERFHWPAIAGVWKPHIGGGTPRDFGPCGDVLDRNCPLLFRHFERRYAYFLPVTPPVEECMLVPFYIEGKAVGTIWAIAHDDRRKFDREDLRLLVSLGAFASASYHAVEQLRALREQSHNRQDPAQTLLEMNEALLVSSVHQHELTEQAEKAEAAQRDSHTRFEALFDASPVGMYLVDSELRIRLVSRTARPVFGDIGELIGRDHAEVMHILWSPKTADEIVGRFRQTLETGEPYRAAEFSEERADRKAREYYDWQIQRISLPDGQYGVVCYSIDISERMRLSNELRQYAAELSESDRHKNEFLAMLAHELRNPLAPISNCLQVLRLTAGKEQDIQAAADAIEDQVGQLVRLVDDLLDVSRISRGKIELRRERIELASALHNTIEAMQSHYNNMERELTVTLPPQPIYLNADSARLTQLVGNLLNNACKFTDNGGRVWLTVEREGEQAVIRVRDNGIGIAADQLHRIFEIFVQVDTSLERSLSGLGIGLTLVKTLAEMHNGTVEVHSAGLGQGSEFLVRLPISVEASKPSPAEPTVSEPATTTARRILVVDDNRNALLWLARLLQVTGNETYTAYDGVEAVEAALRFRPDVVLLDIGLPKLNGYEVARKIREQPWGKRMLLVALTGWGLEEDRQKSREAGFNGHMVKPVDYAELMKLLASLFEQAGEITKR